MTDDKLAVRLKLFIESLGITFAQFADTCGIPRPSLSQFLTGRNKKISNTYVEQIHDAYPTLNIMWFLFNEGDMLVSPEASNGDMEKHDVAGSKDKDDSVDDLSIFSFSDFENLENSSDDTSKSEKAREIPLSFDNFDAKHYVDEINDLQNKISKLQGEIEFLRKNPRRVTQITIYFDDSTFETFTPSK